MTFLAGLKYSHYSINSMCDLILPGIVLAAWSQSREYSVVSRLRFRYILYIYIHFFNRRLDSALDLLRSRHWSTFASLAPRVLSALSVSSGFAAVNIL